jgi:hypothetical protein
LQIIKVLLKIKLLNTNKLWNSRFIVNQRQAKFLKYNRICKFLNFNGEKFVSSKNKPLIFIQNRLTNGLGTTGVKFVKFL